MLRKLTTDGFHIKSCLGKGIIDLVAHLKAFQMDARTYLCDDVTRLGAIDC